MHFKKRTLPSETGVAAPIQTRGPLAPLPNMLSRPSPWKPCLFLLLLPLPVALVMASPDAIAQHASARAAIEFSIGPGTLAGALRQFAVRAGITLSYAPALVAGKTSAGLAGRHTVTVGLVQLLEGSGVMALVQDNGDYVLQAASRSEAAAAAAATAPGLPPVQVRGAPPPSLLGDTSASSHVTASAVDTPRSSTIITAELMHETQAASLADVLRSVPGVSFRGADSSSAPAGDRPIIRGFDAAGSVYVDGMRSTGPQGREIFALEQVEVLQGPASVYGGRGAGGGTVNLVSKTPKAQDATSAEFGLGSAGYARATLDANRVLDADAHIAARLNLMWQDSAKAGREQVTYRRWGVAPSITFGVDSPERLILSYYHLQSADMPDYSVPYARGGGAPANLASGTPFLGLLARDYLDGSTDIVQVELRRRLAPDLAWRAMTQYTRVKQSFVATNPQWAGSSGEQLALQAKSGLFDVDSLIHQSELNGVVQWGGAEHSWLAGAELSRERGRRDAFDVRDQSGASLAGSGSCTVAYNCTSFAGWDAAAPWTGSVGGPTGSMGVSTVTDSAALYVQDTARLSPAWLLNGALRYERFATRANGGGAGAGELSNHEGDWNYQLGVVHQPRQGVRLYLSWATSSNPVGGDAGVGADAISLSNRDLAPERARSLEAGIKLDLAGDELQFNAAVFRTIKDNARISVSRDTITGATQSVRGLELGLRGNVSRDWQVFAGLALLDSRIVDGGSAPANTGRDFPLTPHNAATLWSSYRFAPGWKAGAGVSWSARMYANASNTNFVPAYAKFDAMLSWQASARLSLQLNVYNLGDKRYYDTAYPVYATLAPRRWAALSARVNY